jgi:hypothetical protein
MAGQEAPRYRFDHGVLGDADVSITDGEITLGSARVSLAQANPFVDSAPAESVSDNSNDGGA